MTMRSFIRENPASILPRRPGIYGTARKKKVTCILTSCTKFYTFAMAASLRQFLRSEYYLRTSAAAPAQRSPSNSIDARFRYASLGSRTLELATKHTTHTIIRFKTKLWPHLPGPGEAILVQAAVIELPFLHPNLTTRQAESRPQRWDYMGLS